MTLVKGTNENLKDHDVVITIEAWTGESKPLTLDQIEELVIKAYRKKEKRHRHLAKILGISKDTLYKRMKRYAKEDSCASSL